MGVDRGAFGIDFPARHPRSFSCGPRDTMTRLLALLRFWLTPLALLSLAAASSAQDATGTLYTRADDGMIRAAIRIELEFGAHIYHGPTKKDLGHVDAVGQPTTATFLGGGIEWSDVRFPEPEEIDQSEFGPGVFINAHEDELVLYAIGRVVDPAAIEKLQVKVEGLVCDDLGCMPYGETLKSKSRGPDALFAAFPSDLKPKPPVPKTDDLVSGEADGTLYSRVVDGRVQVAVQLEITPDWHLYHEALGHEDAIGLPTTLSLKGEGITWGKLRWPTPEELDQSEFGPGVFIYAHEGTIVVYAEGTVEGGEASTDGVWATIGGQTCDDASCITYKETLANHGAGADAIWAGFPKAEEGSDDAGDDKTAGSAAGSLSSSTPPAGGSEEEESSLALFLLEAIGWGLFTLLMPCTYPMIPITISFFTKQADQRGGNVLPLSLTYGAGIVLIFILIGVAVGPVIVAFATHPVTNLIIAAMFFYFALVLLGFVNLQPPRALLNVAGKASMRGGFVGVFLMGATLVVTSFTCTAPFVGTLLARGAGGGMERVVWGMGAFGLTMAVPFVILSLVPGKIQSIPKSGQWMNTLKMTLGFVEIAAAIKFLSNTDLGWDWNVISREMFLASWVVIFVITGLFLFGIIRIKGPAGAIGGIRRSFAVLFLAFAAYCGWGLAGNSMDKVMNTMAPPYSGGRLFPELFEFGGDWLIVKDDYDKAMEQARADNKLVMVNFTGHT